MYCRTRATGGQSYLEILESRRVNGRNRKRVIASIGRVDRLATSGGLEGMIRSSETCVTSS